MFNVHYITTKDVTEIATKFTAIMVLSTHVRFSVRSDKGIPAGIYLVCQMGHLFGNTSPRFGTIVGIKLYI